MTTEIQWCDSTCNPAMGCAGCELHPDHCYAKAWCDRWAGRKGYPKRFEEPELFPGRIEEALSWPELTTLDRPVKPWLNGWPRVIFLGDPFSPGLPSAWLLKYLKAMAERHIWLLLTKWPDRMRTVIESWKRQYRDPWPRNIWGGTTVTSAANVTRIDALLQCDLPLRFISFEPLLGADDLL